MARIFIYLLYFTFLKPSYSFLEKDMIVKYCKSKHSTMGTIYSCSTKLENIQLIKKLNQAYQRFLTININRENDILEKSLTRKYSPLCIILDGDCENIGELTEKTGNHNYFFETYHWLIITKKSENEKKVTNFLSKANININSDINLAIYSKENNNWTIFDVYNPASKHGGQLIIYHLGFYNKIDGYNAKIIGNKYWIRKNMSNIQFKSAIVLPKLEVKLDEYLASDENRQFNSMHRFQSVTVNHCRDIYNFSLHVQRTNSWGYIQSDGHFDGLVSLLEKRIVDFGSSPLVYKLDRMPVIDYGYGNWILRSTFIYRKPKVSAASYQIFLRPLSTNVWICILIIMILILILLKIIFHAEQIIHAKRKNGTDTDSAWSYLFLFTFGAFCQQGSTYNPVLLSSRTLYIFIFLFCILIFQFYSASIVSYLLMDPSRTINNLKDLTDSSLNIGIEDILIDRDYFVQTTDPAAIELYEKKIKGSTNNSGFYSPSEGLKLVKNSGFAFHVETSTAYPIIEDTFSNEEICDLEEVQMYQTQPMHTNLQKNSPFREMMNYCMLRLVEDGNMDRLRKHWDARKPACIESAKKILIHVGLSEFSCGLIVLAYGILLSLIILIIEILLHRKMHYN